MLFCGAVLEESNISNFEFQTCICVFVSLSLCLSVSLVFSSVLHGIALQAPLAGFGFGLPLSRVYARYFGGDLNVVSIEGFGTDAYVHLKRAAADAGEVLPAALRVDTTSHKLTTRAESVPGLPDPELSVRPNIKRRN